MDNFSLKNVTILSKGICIAYYRTLAVYNLLVGLTRGRAANGVRPPGARRLIGVWPLGLFLRDTHATGPITFSTGRPRPLLSVRAETLAEQEISPLQIDQTLLSFEE